MTCGRWSSESPSGFLWEQGSAGQGFDRPCRAGRPIGPWSRRTGAPEASATGRDRSPPVHGGYTRSRQVGECNGHERSPRELRNRRSDSQRSRHQAPLRRRARVRVSPPGCREPSGLLPATRLSPRDRPHPPVEREPSPPGTRVVVLGGRATRVP
jgi:hypothetical protein